MSLSVAYLDRTEEAMRPPTGIKVVTNEEDPRCGRRSSSSGWKGGALLLGELAGWQMHGQ
jgi:hypothetical protein